jgi:hypothetical protein
MRSRPAITRIELKSKRIGADEFRQHGIGTACRVERNGACEGEFLIWFPGRYYVKIDAVQLHDTIQYTDNRVQL